MHRSMLPKNRRSSSFWLTRVLGLPSVRGHVALVLALVVNSLGAGLSGPLILLYAVSVVGLPVATAGVVLTAAGVVSLSVPAGSAWLSARLGARRIVVIALALQTCGMAGLLVAARATDHGLPLVAACCVLISVGQRAFWSSVFALVADAADRVAAATDDDDDARITRNSTDAWFALAGMAQNVGYTLGALIGGALLIAGGTLPYEIALGMSALCFALSGILLATASDDVGHQHAVSAQASVLSNRPYLEFIAANALLCICSAILAVGLPTYLVVGLGAPRWLVGPLMALNTGLGALCQGTAARATRHMPRAHALILSGIVWALWGLGMAALDLAPRTAVIPGLVVSVLVYSVAELIHAPLSNALAADAAPAESRDAYLAWFQYSFTIASIITPGLFALTFSVAAPLPWLVTSFLAIIGCLGIFLIRSFLAAAS